jgi:hypothetical protein
MTDTTDSTEEDVQTQPQTKQDVETLPDKEERPNPKSKIRGVGDEVVDYYPEEVREFINTVFHADITPGAHRLVYKAKYNNPGMPHREGVDHLIDQSLTRLTKARVLYFNASTCVRDDKGVLRHKRDLFSAFHVLVLDDIGTKIPLDKLPKALRDNPTYIIESSEGNFQYGYVLETPIQDYDHALALIQTVAMAGMTDSGGLMATKIVRLPAGVNGKKDPDKRLFNVKLHTMGGPYWTPEILLKHINFELNNELVTWDKIVEGSLAPLAKKYHTKYLPHNPVSQATNGAIDPVLEWLYAENMVLADSGNEWVDIRCPWAHTHSDGEDSAGYTPIGRGDVYTRGFNCFHEHCADSHTKEFLQYVLSNSDFGCIPIRDPSAGIFEVYCFEESNNRAWRLNGATPTQVDINGFRTKHNQPVTAYKLGSKGLQTRAMTVAQLWLESPYRQDVHGVVHNPGDTLFVEDGKYKTISLNTYRPPAWGEGNFDNKHVKKFNDYLDYIIPDETERLYFLDWVTSKMQNPLFRGTGIVMVTPAYGVGRNTLAGMISELVGRHNAVEVSFDDLLGATDYNYWELAQIVIVAEAKESTDYMTSKGPHKAYETLKQRVDTTNNYTTVNIKHVAQRTVHVCTSYMILTQHTDAIAIPEDDRRLSVISNPLSPESPAFFTKVNAWLRAKDENGDAEWAKSVYRWLMTREVKDPDRLMLPLNNAGKRAMINEGQALPAQVCSAISRHLISQGLYALSQHQFRAIMDMTLAGLNYNREHRATFYRNSYNDVSVISNMVVRLNGRTSRVRVFKPAITSHDLTPELLKMTNGELPHDLKCFLTESVDKVDVNAVSKHLLDTMAT